MRKNIFAIAISLIICGFSSCNNDDDIPYVTPSERGTVTDNQGNEYEWVRIGDQMWTTSNAKNGTDIVGAEYYNTHEWVYVIEPDTPEAEEFENEYKPVYGNLMNLEDAIASAPEGWRVPTDEDWQKLERTLGMKNTDAKGFRGEGVAFSMTDTQSGSELGLRYGGGCFPKAVYGWISMSLDYVGEKGYYWSTTIDDSYEEDYQMAYVRSVTANYGKVSRACMRADCYLSVRWVKDVK